MTTSTTYAIVNSDGVCINRCLWDGESNWQPPEGCTIRQIPDNSPIGIGWKYANGEFTPPPEPESVETSAPLLELQATAEKLEAAGFSVEELRALLLGPG